MVKGPQRALGGEHYSELEARARELVAAGRGRELIQVPGWWYVLSAESLIDRFTTMPDILTLAPKIACPVLYIRGDREMMHAYPAEAFCGAAGGPCDVEIVPDCDHFYKGREHEITARVVSWLAKRFPQ